MTISVDLVLYSQEWTRPIAESEGPRVLFLFSVVLELLDVMLGSDNGFLKVYNDIEKRTNDMNEIYRAFKKTEYDKGQHDAVMSLYQNGDLLEAAAAKKLSMSVEEFLEAYEKWLESTQNLILA